MTHTQSSLRVADLVAAAKRSSPEIFVHSLAPAVLIGPEPPAMSEAGWNYRTDRRMVVPGTRLSSLLKSTYLVKPLRKRKDRPFSNTILIGRAATNDLVLEHQSVSKLHARIRLEEAGRTLVSDAGSSNGTLVDGKLLEPDAEHPLADGMELCIGDFGFHYWVARSLHGVLLSLRED